jgi:predicted glycogen debranching enzyme
LVDEAPARFLSAITNLADELSKTEKNFPEFSVMVAKLIAFAKSFQKYPRVITWTLLDCRRITLVPSGHWLLIEDSAPFRATLSFKTPDTKSQIPIHVQSIAAGKNHVAVFAPREISADAGLILERYAATSQKISAAVRFLSANPETKDQNPKPEDLVLLTNGIGGMTRMCVDLGRVNSKYDCVLGANLNPNFPVDRHVFVKRIRVWVNADGFLSPLDFKNLASFDSGPPAVWNFIANAGDGRTVEIELRAKMLDGKNTTVIQFSRPTEKSAHGKQLPAAADVRLTVRVDIEDRNFHSETKRNGGADYHFSTNTREIKNSKFKIQNCVGFEFTPAPDRQLHIFSDTGEYHPQPEWCENIPHPVEQSRGQVGGGDAYSPGWFEIPLVKGAIAILTATAEISSRSSEREFAHFGKNRSRLTSAATFEEKLLFAAPQFVVRRDKGKTIIAGYPWFLDWGRDSLICARGLLAAGMTQEVKQLLLTFAKFEKDGTLPNTIHGGDVSNRDTSDAPLWFAVVCEEISEIQNSKKFYETRVDENGRTIFDVLKSIAENYARGTPNGISMDADSALIWSPSHFTWMDTNFPAGTPREGYPVEIQVLWIRLLRQLEKISEPAGQKKWRELAGHATASFEKLFWLEDKGWFADVLLGGPRVIARDAIASDALRSNCLFVVSLGLISGERAKRCVEAAQKYLVVPGALRTLAPLPVSTPLPIYRDGHLLNNPVEPYWPRYEGDEDTRRKPAYHNGTAWTWTFPVFCEARARAWDFSPEAVAAAKAYLGSSEKILNEGCLGQIPEILDGDAPHTQRGCDAQAWGVTETLRVWKLLNSRGAQAE